MGKSYLYALGIGSNMGERKQNLQNAVSALARLPKPALCSALRFMNLRPWAVLWSRAII